MIAKWKKISSAFLAMVFIFGLVGCSANAVAKVNNNTISKTQLDKRIDKQQKLMEAQGAKFVKKKGDKMYEAVRTQVLDGMIDELLTVQAAEKEGIKISTKEIDDKLAEIKKQFKDEKEYQAALKSFGFTDQEMKDYLKQQIAATKLKDKITTGIKITDAEVKKYYDDNKSQMKQPESIKVSDIMVSTEAEANQIIADLKAGKDFAQLAKDKSKDQSSKGNGGLYVDSQSGVQYWSKGQGLNTAWGQDAENAAFALKKGEYTQKAVKGQNGFYVIKLEDKKDAKDLSYDEVKVSLKSYILGNKKQEKFNNYIADFKKKANIKKYPEK